MTKQPSDLFRLCANSKPFDFHVQIKHEVTFRRLGACWLHESSCPDRWGGSRRGGRGRQYVPLQDVAAWSGDRHVSRRGDTGEGTQVPCRAAEERSEETGLRKRARHAAEHADAGEQAADASSGAPRLVQVSALPCDS